MSLAKKARESLEAGTRLTHTGHPNAAASRLYYALYQAAVYVLETKLGKKPTDYQEEPGYWKHDIICNNAGLVRGRRSRDDRILYNALKGLRVEADYDPTSVEMEQILGRIDDVRELVEEVT